jgi:ribosomal protein S18 acetylase RimI-like enzyme
MHTLDSGQVKLMTRAIRLATVNDIEELMRMMAEFYAETGTPMTDSSREAFSQLLYDETLGRIWILTADDAFVGYAILTFGFSLEYGGRDAFIDDLYVRSGYRGEGLGRLAMETLLEESRRLKIRALHLEVDRDNDVAQRLYQEFGFVDHGRQLMTAALPR